MRLMNLIALVGIVALSFGCSDSSPGGQPAPEPYAASICVGDKQAAAATLCKSLFDVHATFLMDQDDAARITARDAAIAEFGTAWEAAEATARNAKADCEDLALTENEAGSSMEIAIGGIVSAITSGLDQAQQAACGSELLTAAGTACKAVLDAEGEHISDMFADSDGSTLEGAKSDAVDAFLAAWDEATSENCPTNATSEDVSGLLAGLTDALVDNTIVTPGVSATQFITLTPEPTEYLGRTYQPTCMESSTYRFFAKRGSVNKLVMYYQGGGACWDNLTCGGTPLIGALCKTDTMDDDPNQFDSGFGDLLNDNNPFQDWHWVFVSYCTCDIHFGDETQNYGDVTVQHKGYHNSKVAEKWAREHFLNPEEVFVTGSSAGAYGAWFNGPLLHGVWPASQMHVLADAGNGVITQDFLDDEFSNWNFVKNLPPIPGVKEALEETGMPGYTEAVATYFPGINWAHYSTKFDGGGGGQTGFYNVMRQSNPLDWPNWWLSSCEFGDVAVQQSLDTYDAVDPVSSNYRYYFGTGSRHTMFGNNKVYTDITGGVPTIVSWVNAMLGSDPGAPDPGWTNVLCNDCGLLLDGDPTPPEEPTFPLPFVREDESIIRIVCE